MPEYLAPGLFIEEIDSGSKPIEGVGTSTAAFIGYAKSGDFNKPTFITNWTQFCNLFGEDQEPIMLGLAKELGVTTPEIITSKQAIRPVQGWIEYARNVIDKSAKGTGPKISVKTWPEFVKKYNVPNAPTPYFDGSYLAHAVWGFYQNGGGRCYVIRVARPQDMEPLAFSGNGAAKSVAAEPVPAQITAGPLLLTSAKTGAGGNNTRVEIEHSGAAKEGGFKLKVTQGDVTETFPAGADDKPLTTDTVETAVNGVSKLLQVEVTRGTKVESRPNASVFTLIGGLDATANLPAKAAGSTSLAKKSPGGNGLSSLQADDFIGSPATRTGLGGLAPLEGVNMVCMPDLMAGVWQREQLPAGSTGVGPEQLSLSEERTQAILDMQMGLVAHCESNPYRMAIIDPIPGLNAKDVDDLVNNTNWACSAGQAALYYPWIKVSDPLNKGQRMFVPPCGHVAGVWARVSIQRGVHKAPANEAIIGAVELETDVTKGEQELLNPDGINCIRQFPGRGIRIWGARTLATRANPSWKYVNVRRLFNYLEESMERNLQWAVFEPNDHDLWGRIRRTIASFLWVNWKEGMLFGTTPADAFYVKCDEETNPQEMIDQGRLYCEVGLNPVKPAEFVIVRMGQWDGGRSMVEAG